MGRKERPLQPRSIRTMRFRAPAKVNFLLQVRSRRADGYHEIDSIFVPVDLYDEVGLTVGGPPGELRLHCDDPTVPLDSRSTLRRAVEEFYRGRAARPGLARSEAVRAAAARVGADVPFFLWCCPARVRGIGDVVEPLPRFPETHLAIVYPGFLVETRWAYEEWDDLRATIPGGPMFAHVSGR
jgi:4-diphosphocytidyl-2-C-methyl-D-erythritol kinase